VHIRRLRIARHTDRPDPSLIAQTKTQHHNQWQRQTVRPQLHGLPTYRLIPQLPTIGIATQAAKRLRVCQQNLSRQCPNAMSQAAKNAEQTGPDRHGKKKQRTQREKLGQKIRRQQLP
jgi:hypothetical protein